MKKNRIGALIVAVFVIVLIVAVLAVAVFIAVFAIRGGSPADVSQQTIETTSETIGLQEESAMTVDIAYDFALKFPERYADVLVHEQEVHGEATTEIFSLREGETDIPLFRIDFGDETAGDWYGMLNVDGGSVPVVYTVFALSNAEVEAMDGALQERYIALMNGFNDALNAIAADPRFSVEKPLDVGAEKKAELAYWSVTLPGRMSWSETAENGEYQAIFYGEVLGEQTALYTVRIGDAEGGSILGRFKVGQEYKSVSVESFDLSRKSGWTDEDYSIAYRMMDTINDVIDAIMNSEHYAESAMD